MDETNSKPAVSAGDEEAANKFGIDTKTMRANAREFQNQLHEAIAGFVKDFNEKHSRKDVKCEKLEAYGVYAMFTYSVRSGEDENGNEEAAAVVTGTSQNYSPGGAEGFETLMKGLTDGFAEHKKEITFRALMHVLGRPRSDDSEVPKGKLN